VKKTESRRQKIKRYEMYKQRALPMLSDLHEVEKKHKGNSVESLKTGADIEKVKEKILLKLSNLYLDML